MSCPSCASDHQEILFAEMVVHNRGLKNLDKPGVWVFPELLVCVECGFSSFTAPEAVLQTVESPYPRQDVTNAQLILGLQFESET
jgi:hypothetical protein